MRVRRDGREGDGKWEGWGWGSKRREGSEDIGKEEPLLEKEGGRDSEKEGRGAREEWERLECRMCPGRCPSYPPHGFLPFLQDLMYSFRQTYKCPDVSPASIHLAADRILRDSHYTTRYEMYLGGLHSPHRLITCDVHTRTWDSEEVETCFDRLCLYDVSQECAALEPKKKKKHHHQMV